MSEYQYYEFQAVDQPLTEREMEQLRQLSSRAEITDRSFANEYNYGDFRGDERKVVEKYFDAFVYLANWGSRRLIFRLPKKLFDKAAAEPYLREDAVEVWEKGDFVLVQFAVDEEPVGWEQGEGWLDQLLPIRDQLLRGDLRSLYIGWLSAVRFVDPEEMEDDAVEPPLPPGIQKLDKALKSLAEFLFLEDDLLQAASRAGSGQAAVEPAQADVRAWVAKLPAEEKTELLCRVIEENQGPLGIELLRRFQEETRTPVQRTTKKNAGASGRRTERQLLEAAQQYAGTRKQREAAAKVAARKKHLADVAKRENAIWQEIDQYLKTKSGSQHQEAVKLLRDLVDMAAETGREDEMAARIRKVREANSTRQALLKRMNAAGLPQ